MPFLQDVIHKLEVGGGLKWFRTTLVILALLATAGLYDWFAFRGMASQEAMDGAQLARNISEGKGYTTLFIRPFSIYLLKQRARERGEPEKDPARLKVMHPDLANPPVYPVILAGGMKALRFHYELPNKAVRFWSPNRVFARYQPDFLITILNQLILFGLLVTVFFLARRLFDRAVAWLSTALLLCTELLWRFSVSGLSTILLMVIFMTLAWCMVLLEGEAREPKRGLPALFVLAGLAGVLVGLGGLTRYSFCWLMIPVVVFLILFSGPQRIVLSLLALGTFVVVVMPWVIRNYHVSGTLFGTAGYAVMENTLLFTENHLQRSLEPDLTRHPIFLFWLKLMTNLKPIIQSELPRLGGSWLSAFFLVGLMVNFRSPAIRRLRIFMLMCIPVLASVQALGRTQLSEESPEINSENLLVLLAPLALVYGVSLFLMLLDQVNLPAFELRYLIIAAGSLLASLPMIFVFLPPRTDPVAWPPYHPVAIQYIASWLKEEDFRLTMSDVPWAMAWYGKRQSIWLTLRATPDPKDALLHEDFLTISDYQKPISVLYLTPQTMDNPVKAGERSWGNFILNTVAKGQIPEDFPLRKAQPGWLPSQLVLADLDRWTQAK